MPLIIPEISVVLPQDENSSEAVVRAMVGSQVLLELERMPGAQALAVACALRQLVQQVITLNGLEQAPVSEATPPWEEYAPGTAPQAAAS
jgi:hypothetical protein